MMTTATAAKSAMSCGYASAAARLLQISRQAWLETGGRPSRTPCLPRPPSSGGEGIVARMDGGSPDA